ncbi:hypothetical protein BX666DRAFT_25627 [Dichotomocladium elegans]|nr:hypothetical protein BX666DRAFT_25627 [Dichotomocladium elegans]
MKSWVPNSKKYTSYCYEPIIGLFSRLSVMKQHSENSEQILSDLDEHIAAVETILIELDGKSNRWQVIFTLHAAILWALSLIFSFFVIRRNGLEPAIFLGLPTVAGPGLIYYGRGAIRWFLKREQRKYYAKLSALRTRRTARRRPLQQEQGIPKRNEYRLICKQCYAYNGIVQDPKDLRKLKKKRKK